MDRKHCNLRGQCKKISVKITLLVDPGVFLSNQWKRNTPGRTIKTFCALKSEPGHYRFLGKFGYWGQIGSPIHHNPTQLHEGAFLKFHTFCVGDLQKDGEKIQNKATSK
jgi:hypothetical protein